jgi:hypothetical protein
MEGSYYMEYNVQIDVTIILYYYLQSVSVRRWCWPWLQIWQCWSELQSPSAIHPACPQSWREVKRSKGMSTVILTRGFSLQLWWNKSLPPPPLKFFYLLTLVWSPCVHLPVYRTDHLWTPVHAHAYGYPVPNPGTESVEWNIEKKTIMS